MEKHHIGNAAGCLEDIVQKLRLNFSKGKNYCNTQLDSKEELSAGLGGKTLTTAIMDWAPLEK